MCVLHIEINVITMLKDVRLLNVDLFIAECTGPYVYTAFHSVQSASQFATAAGCSASL